MTVHSTEKLYRNLEKASEEKKLLSSAVENITYLLEASDNLLYRQVIEELCEKEQWSELNNRFFKKITFGTGGLRGRCIGHVIAETERGNAQSHEVPKHPCVGTNCLNYFTLSMVTQGIVHYLKEQVAENALGETPTLIFSHDIRHYARQFAEHCAQICSQLGAHVYLFREARSTPQLSFTIRKLGAHAGVMLTASHNPPHDNGYKVYGADGAQVVGEHARGMIDAVYAIKSEKFTPLPKDQWGEITVLGEEIDRDYREQLTHLVLKPELFKQHPLKIIYTALHGTGKVIIPKILEKLPTDVQVVSEQNIGDGNFSTVDSPNPEYASALTMAIELAEKEEADLVVGTDPDCDRMGAAVRNSQGELVLLTGNQIGALIAYYRTKTLFDKKILDEGNKGKAVIISTFVSSDLQKRIAEHFGVRYVETLTGFKYIAAKLKKYEKEIPSNLYTNYTHLSEGESRSLRLQHATYFIAGSEESYGFLGSDTIRDKDGNGAVVMLSEVAAYAYSQGMTLIDLLDEIYKQLGYYAEDLHSLFMEGAEGAQQIEKLATSYAESPPRRIGEVEVTCFRDFFNEEQRDSEGDLIPREKMFFVHLKDGSAFAVRPSGTEPKIKYYLYGVNPPPGRLFSDAELIAAKEKTQISLEKLWKAVEEDAQRRLAI